MDRVKEMFKDAVVEPVAKGCLGMITIIASLRVTDVEQWARILSQCVGIMVGIWTIYSLWLGVKIKRAKLEGIRNGTVKPGRSSSSSSEIIGAMIAFGLCWMLMGCSGNGRGFDRMFSKKGAKQEQIEEESRALTTGTVDALEQAPRNDKAVNLARELAKADQQVEGMPQKRLPVAAALADDPKALKEMERRLAAIPVLQAELAEVNKALAEKDAQLREMGRKYEEERNTKLRTRIKRWVLGTLGIGGLIALLVFCPALLVPFGHLLAFIVGRIPKLAGALGIVAKKGFDEVVRSVGETRAALKASQSPDKIILDNTLAENTSTWTKALIDHRRKALNV